MHTIFNFDSLLRNQRFARAILFGSITAIVSAVIYAFFRDWAGYYFSYLSIGIGFLIGKSILHFGRGVQVKFSILSAVLALLSLILSTFLSFFLLASGNFTNAFSVAYEMTLFYYGNLAFTELFIHGITIYVAYVSARVV